MSRKAVTTALCNFKIRVRCLTDTVGLRRTTHEKRFTKLKKSCALSRGLMDLFLEIISQSAH